MSNDARRPSATRSTAPTDRRIEMAGLLATIGLIAPFLLFGCTTPMVSSRPISGLTPQDREGTLAYSLPKTMVRIEFKRDQIVLPGQVFVKGIAVADPAHSYLLRYKPNPFSDDKLTIKMEEGQPFISQVNGVAIDRTSDSITNAVEGGARGIPYFLRGPARTTDEPPVIELIFDPHDPDQLQAAREQLGRWGLDVACLPACPMSTPTAVGEADGIYARATIPLELAICRGNCAVDAPGKIQTVASYNASPLIQIPVRRTSFADRETIVDFDRGAIRLVQHDKESEAVAIARLPGAVVGSIFNGLIAGAKDRTAVLTAQKNTLSAEKSLLEKRHALLRKQREYAEIETERASRFFGVTPRSNTSASGNGDASSKGSDRYKPAFEGGIQPPPKRPPEKTDASLTTPGLSGSAATDESVLEGFDAGFKEGYRYGFELGFNNSATYSAPEAGARPGPESAPPPADGTLPSIQPSDDSQAGDGSGDQAHFGTAPSSRGDPP